MVNPLWLDDPQRVARAIHCHVCLVCHWAEGGFLDCIYGGPYQGYEAPTRVIEKVVSDTK